MCSDAEAELEKRLEKLRTVKGATPYGQGSKADKKPAAASSTAAGASPSSAVPRFPRSAQDFSSADGQLRSHACEWFLMFN